jgi:hypothetical protein
MSIGAWIEVHPNSNGTNQVKNNLKNRQNLHKTPLLKNNCRSLRHIFDDFVRRRRRRTPKASLRWLTSKNKTNPAIKTRNYRISPHCIVTQSPLQSRLSPRSSD